MSAKPQVSAQNFFRRVKSLYTHWKDTQKEFSDIDAICIQNGKDEESMKIKTTAVYVWLFGYEFLDSWLFFTKNGVIFLASQKHISYIEHFSAEKGDFNLDLDLLVKDDTDNSRNFETIRAKLEAESDMSKLKIGKLVKERQVSPFSSEVEGFLQKLSATNVEIGPLVQECLCVKESDELEIVRKAGKVAVWFEDKVIMEVENIIDNEAKTTHSAISKKIENMLESDTKSLEAMTKADKQFADLSYTPIIQSGGEYDLRPQAESNDENLSYDTIICSVGAKYYEYNCNVVRTLFIDPDTEQKQNYNIAHELQNVVISKLKPGNSLKSVYEAGVEFIKNKKEDLLAKLPTNLGFGIGLEFREHNLGINPKNEKLIEPGMVFNITISFNGLKSKKGKNYAIMLADTIIVRPAGTNPEVLTAKIPRKYEEISYALEGDQPEEEKKKSAAKPAAQQTQATASKRNRDGVKTEFDEVKRREHQRQLRAQHLAELEERFASGNFYGDKAKTKIETEKLVAYKKPEDLPKDLKKNQIYVDVKNGSIVCPIMGQMVPFHVNVIKSINKQEEDRKVIAMRINFHIPVATASTIVFPENPDPNVMYIRELTFKSRNFKNVNDTIKKVKDLQKKVKDQATEEREKSTSYNPEVDPLILIKGKRPVLQDLKVRPNISAKKTSGVFEAHTNGFRFSTKTEKIDITFKNIKHAFFQPCDQEMIILLHFNLHKPIYIGKKRTADVQFYTEAGLQAEDLDMRRRGNDDDEYEQEERDRVQRKKLNDEFLNFTRAVEAAAGKDQIEFDKPYRELAFQGAPSKSNVYLFPTVHSLVNLSEPPFFIMSLDEVEVAHFERVQYSLRNFDLCFIYKDYNKPVTRICAIPANYLEGIKNWLDKMDIIFSEATVNFDWNKIMNEVRTQIKNNPKKFIEDGGWDFLQPSGSEEGGLEGGFEEGDSEFSVSSEEFEEESESEFSEAEEDFDDDEESDFEGDSDLEEEGLSWDEMEEMAEKEDLRKIQQREVGKNVKIPMKGGISKPPMKGGNSKPPMKGMSKQPPKKIKK